MSAFRLFDTVGRDLFSQSLNNSHSGNMSLRRGAAFLITASGSMLHRLEHSDLVEAPIHVSKEASHKVSRPGAFFTSQKQPSREAVVHREIYAQTDAAAIVHAHPPFTVTIAEKTDMIRPYDAEGAYYFSTIPVVSAKTTIASSEIAEIVPKTMLKHKIPLAVVRGHGVFSCGRDLVEAFKWISSLENSCRLLLLKSLYRDI